MECCNTPYVTCHICIPTLAIFGTKLFYFLVVGFLSPCVFPLSGMSYHVIMCIAFAYMFVSCIRAFSPLFVLQSGAPMSPGAPFYLFSCVGVKRFRIGPRLVKWSYYTTRRLPVKFRSIRRSFGTPTVNRASASPFECPAKTPSKTSPKPTKLSSML